jgi:hypothetical protein
VQVRAVVERLHLHPPVGAGSADGRVHGVVDEVAEDGRDLLGPHQEPADERAGPDPERHAPLLRLHRLRAEERLQVGLVDEPRADRRERDGPLLEHAREVAVGLVDPAGRDEAAHDVEAVRELVPLHPERRGHRGDGGEASAHRLDVRLVTQHHHGAEVAPVAGDAGDVDEEEPVVDHRAQRRGSGGGRSGRPGRVPRAGPRRRDRVPQHRRDAEVRERAADRIDEAEELRGARVADRDAPVGAESEHALAHSGEHGRLVLHEARELGRLEPEREAGEPPREDPAGHGPDAEREQGDDRDGRDVDADGVPHGRRREPDADLADDAGVGVVGSAGGRASPGRAAPGRAGSVRARQRPHRHLRPRRLPERAGGPRHLLAPSERDARIRAHELPELGRVGMREPQPPVVGDHDEEGARALPHRLGRPLHGPVGEVGRGGDAGIRGLGRHGGPERRILGGRPRDGERRRLRLLAVLRGTEQAVGDRRDADHHEHDEQLEDEGASGEVEPRPPSPRRRPHPLRIMRRTSFTCTIAIKRHKRDGTRTPT